MLRSRKKSGHPRPRILFETNRNKIKIKDRRFNACLPPSEGIIELSRDREWVNTEGDAVFQACG
jgi:hypothetical protein